MELSVSKLNSANLSVISISDASLNKYSVSADVAVNEVMGVNDVGNGIVKSSSHIDNETFASFNVGSNKVLNVVFVKSVSLQIQIEVLTAVNEYISSLPEFIKNISLK